MMSQITRKIYLGNKYNAKSKEWLSEHNITHIVNCSSTIKNYHPDLFIYHNMNMDDHDNQSLFPYVDNAYEFIHNAIINGGIVFIHCFAGISRSSSTLIYYLMKKYNISYDRAYYFVKSRRSIIRPNEGFVKQLKF